MTRAHASMIAATALCAAAGLANADTYIMTYTGHGNGRTVEYVTDGSSNWNSTFAGEFLWNRTGGTAPGALGAVSTFCIELTDSNPSTGSTGNTYNRVVHADIPTMAPTDGPMGTTNRNYLGELYALAYGTLDFNSDEQMAAFQLAVWECVYDSGLSLSAGNFRARSTVATSSYNMAAAWLGQLNVNGTGPIATLTAMTNDHKQDHIIPTPGAAALAGLGMLAMGRRRR